MMAKVRRHIAVVVWISLGAAFLPGCSPGSMTLALGGSSSRVEFGLPGRCCDVAWLELRRTDNSDVLWRVEAETHDSRLPFPAIVGETPSGYRATVTFDRGQVQSLVQSDTTLEIDASVGRTTPFRLSEMSATGRIVQLADGSRFVSNFTSMSEYRAAYVQDQSKEIRGNRRALIAWIVAAVALLGGAGVVLLRRRRMSA
ncbi:MAG: hypothetical protein QOD92_807 [Acidimicrobiaceae bacterium]|jgi:hypothetical protein